MGYQYPKDVASKPGLNNVTGKFCFPQPVSYLGTIAASASDPRPLVVGTDITITEVGGDFIITSSAGVGDHWGVNAGDYVAFVNTGIDGIYLCKSVNLATGQPTVVAGPGQAVTTGYVWFIKKDQPITGTGTKFKQLCVGDYLVVMGLSPTVQARKITAIIDDTHLLVEKGFLGTISGLPVMVSKKGDIRGVSVKCNGAGVLMEANVASGDAPTLYDQDGLAPVYGDSGSNVFDILIQK